MKMLLRGIIYTSRRWLLDYLVIALTHWLSDIQYNCVLDKQICCKPIPVVLISKALVLSFLISTGHLHAHSGDSSVIRYGASIYDTQWLLSGSVFACRFEQIIPDYGRAVFIHRAGEQVEFQLEAHNNLMSRSYADIRIGPPPWQPARRSESLGKIKVKQDSPNLKLDSIRTNQFLHALLEGKWPSISHYTYYDRNRYIQAHVSGVRFQEFYLDYNLCVQQLLTTNYNQVAKSKVMFGGGERTIDKHDIDVLDRIIYYVKHDPRITFIYLDGHADNLGRRYDNRQISKARVQSVERYLLKHGIPPEMVTARFHGSRYPIASNATPSGRAQNRRVTIRLEMSEDIPIPDDLIFKLPVNASSMAPATAYYD